MSMIAEMAAWQAAMVGMVPVQFQSKVQQFGKYHSTCPSRLTFIWTRRTACVENCVPEEEKVLIQTWCLSKFGM